MNIIADIAGQYDALMRLVEAMPKEEIVLVGDLVDRGTQSKEVIQWAIDNNVKACLGNHEHMMIDYYDQTEIYDPYIWHMNGGAFTSMQYKNDPITLSRHLVWLKSLPLYYKFDGLFVSHGPWFHACSLEEACSLKLWGDIQTSLIWNRGEPCERDEFQVFGHNSPWGLRWFGERDNPWAVCLDDSNKGVVTGMHWPSKKIYQEPYLKTKKQAEHPLG